MSFLSKKNIHNAIWALIIAFISFIGGLIWKNYSEPEKVIVERILDQASTDTSITIIKFEGDSATINAFKNYNPKLFIKSKENLNKTIVAPIAKRKIVMPKVVKGYTEEKISSYATIKMPRQTFIKGETIEAELEIFNKETLKKISPIYIDLVTVNSDTSVTQVWQEQFRINKLRNIIKFSSDSKKGEYQLSIGFYFMDEINQEFPPKYLKNFTIKII